VFQGTVTYVYPTLAADTRTVPVRIELPNPGLLLKPAMFAQVELAVGASSKVVTIPTSAVIDSGTRRVVLVQLGEGRFEPREVRLGRRGNHEVEVLDGVQAGEPVVVAANFLLDAESNLKAALDGFGHAGHGNAPKPQDAAPATSPPPPKANPAATVGHRAQGTVEDIDAKAGAVTLNHGPVATLKWPAMSMEFLVANPALLSGLGPGVAVSFEFVERKPGEWVITAIKPMADARPGAAPAADTHQKH
jgi:Cu(I)/Ag(I) efflux system membrane fusion protein